MTARCREPIIDLIEPLRHSRKVSPEQLRRSRPPQRNGSGGQRLPGGLIEQPGSTMTTSLQ
jgi:hypothetical protein